MAAKVTYASYASRVISFHIQTLHKLKKDVYKGSLIEPLHDWRVTSRRLRECLWIFKDLFSKRKRKQWNQSIRSQAKLAGQARDLDTHIRFLTQFKRTLKQSYYKEGLEELIQDFRRKRKHIHPQLVQTLHEFENKNTLNELKKFLREKESIFPQGSAHLNTVAQKRVFKRLKRLLALEKDMYIPYKKKELHQMRIAAKHLRYTLETFEKLYGERTRLFIQQVMDVQEILGDVHDYDVWIEFLSDYIKQHRGRATMLLKSHCQKKRRESHRHLIKLWKSYKTKNVWSSLKKFIEAKVIQND